MKHLYLCCLFVLLPHLSKAQCSTDSLNISTGYNPITGTLTTPPAIDPKWTSLNSPAALSAIATDGYALGCYDIIPLGLWTPSGPNCLWISGQNNWGYHTTGTGGDVFILTLSRQIETCSSDSLKININVESDDGITNMYFDGAPIYTVPFACGATGYSNRIFNLGMVTAGTHTFSVVIHNCNNGYYVNAIGMALNGKIFSTTGHSSIKKEDGTTACNVITVTNTSLCGSVGTTLHADTVGTGYIWNTGDTTSGITATTTGSYWVKYNNGGCSSRTDSFHLIISSPPVVDLGPDTTICSGSYALASSATYSGTVAYLWNTGSISPGITATTSGTYWLKVTVNGCSTTDTMHLLISPPLVVNVGNDTTLCDENPLHLSIASVSGYSYLWNTGATTSSIYLSTSGTYWVQVTNSFGCTATDSVHVNYSLPPMVNLGPDTTLCAGTSITLYPHNTYTLPAYQWNTGANSPSISVNSSGIYWLLVADGGCTAVDSVHVNYFPALPVTLGADTVLCDSGQTLLLSSVQPSGTTYLWNNGSTADTLRVNTSGTYWLEVNNGCKVADTIHVQIGETPTATPFLTDHLCAGDTTTMRILDHSANAYSYIWNLGGAHSLSDTTNHNGPYVVQWSGGGTYIISLTARSIEGCLGKPAFDTITVYPQPIANIGISSQTSVRCIGDSVQLTALNINDSNTYRWAPSSYFSDSNGHEVWGIVTNTGYVVLTVTNYLGCVAKDSILFLPECCDLVFPSAFTPNGDGKNDVWRPIGGDHHLYDLRIDNRWGETVFESKKAGTMVWDGTFNGVKQDMNVFYYYVKYECQGHMKLQKGEITLIR